MDQVVTDEDAPAGTCSVDGCARGGRLTLGMCSGHYWRVRVHGDPGTAEIGKLSTSYEAIHSRIRSARGSASDHPCAACWSPANDWSYDHDDPDELDGTTRRGTPVVYSADPAHYVPLCRSCHSEIDAHFSRDRRLDVARICELYEQGSGAGTIARELGCSAPTVRTVLRTAGVVLRPPGGAPVPGGRARCRRGHLLVEPNVVARRPPVRHCLACIRAGRNAASATGRGEPRWTEAQRQARADEHYARIMGEAG